MGHLHAGLDQPGHCPALQASQTANGSGKGKALVIGAAGAIGQVLVQKMLEEGWTVVVALHRSPMPESVCGHPNLVQVFGVDARKKDTLERAFTGHGDVDVVWMLAAPLSVESAHDPEAARDLVVGGMQRLLDVMRARSIPTICFSDSIGSFGASSPRAHVPASWLVSNPTQDPGSAYGRQKRECRALMRAFASEAPSRTARWAVIPGVLHTNDAWGQGTTEYALDALQDAHRGTKHAFALPLDVRLPMIFVDDLVAGLFALMTAPACALAEPEGGYALAGFSFSANQLVAEIRKLRPAFDFGMRADAHTGPVATFAALWPDSLSPAEAKRDLGFSPQVGIAEAVQRILRAWELR